MEYCLIFGDSFGEEMMVDFPVVWDDEIQRLSSEYDAGCGAFQTHFGLYDCGGLEKVTAFDFNPSCESSSMMIPTVSDSGDSNATTTTSYTNRFREVSRFLDKDDDPYSTNTSTTHHEFTQSFEICARGGEEFLPLSTTQNDVELGGGILAILSHCKKITDCSTNSSSVISGGSTESYSKISFQSSDDGRIALTSTIPKRKQTIPFNFKSEAPLPPNMNKKPRRPSKMDFQTQNIDVIYEPNKEVIAQMKEMIYKSAVMRPVNLGPEKPTEKPRRRNVKISNDPQTVAARHRREKIGDRLRVLQKLVPGGNKMDTASMLDEACNYLKYLKSQLGFIDNNLKKMVNSNPDFFSCSSSSRQPFSHKQT